MPYCKGIQQGNLLSPLLFNLYINDIFQSIANKDTVTLDDCTHLNTLMHADDLIVISSTKEGLQNSLDSLQDYCKKWKLDINYKKSKVMVFSKGTQKEKTKYTINNKTLEIVREYLGITINCKNCSFTPTLTD